MADMGWTDHTSAIEEAEYGYWGEAIDAGPHGTVYEESVVMEMRDALMVALLNWKDADPMAVRQMKEAIAKAGMRDNG